MSDRVGQQLGNYQLIRLLGEGGFAEVYLGEHIHLGTQAAIKVLHTQLTSDDVDKFRTEARTIARLIHPHIVRVLEFGVEGKTPFLVMDYASNGTLRQRHPKGVALPLPLIVSYVKQVADALQYAHDEKLIHRDIKPENMLLGRRNDILLSDFGIALVAQSSRYQSAQEMAGTMAYMAPEQIQGKPRPASDQYSLGIVVYEWLSGDRPFHGSLTELVGQHLSILPPSLQEKIPTLPPIVEEVVLTALVKDTKERFGSVQAFATAFEQACRTGISHPPALPYEVVAPSQPSPVDSIAATPPSRLLQPTNVIPLENQLSPLTDVAIPSTAPAVFPPPSEAIPSSVPLSSPEFSTHISPIATQPVAETMVPATNKRFSSFYSTPVPLQSPASQRHNGWKVAVASVSILLVVALLFLLVPYLGRGSNQVTIQGSTRTTSQSSGHGSSPTPQKTAIPVPPKVIYVITDITNNGRNNGQTVSAVQTSDGTSLWRSQMNDESSYTSPTVVGGVVYVATIHFNSSTGYGDGGAVHALRASDGTSLWTYHANSRNGVNGVYVANGVVYVSAEGLYALRATDGSLLWEYQVDGEYITVPSSVVNGVAYTVSGASSGHYCNAYAFRVSDGTILWKYQMNESGSFLQPAVAANGVIYITSPVPFRFFYTYDPSKDIHNTNSAVYALRASDGSLLWKYEIDKESSFLKLEVINGVLYASSGSQLKSNGAIYALQASDGSLLWKYQVYVDNRYGGQTRAIINNGVVYITSQGTNATLYVLKGSDGSLLWQYKLGNGYDPIIVPTNGIVYVGISLGSSSIDALRVSDGSLLWSYQLDSNSDLSALVVARTTLYVGVYGYLGPGSMLALQINNGSLLRRSQGAVRSMAAGS